MLRRRPTRRWLMAATWLALFQFLPARAQQLQHSLPLADPVAESLGLTPDAGSLPPWQEPDAKSVGDLSAQVRRSSPGVFLIGTPEAGFGTGFLISKERRLLATNAHVADLGATEQKLLAIGNETSQVFKVDRVWYHPGVIRQSKAGVNVRAQNPSMGSVYPMGPDVAVLHLAGDAPLPDALPLATPEEVNDLFGKPIGMIGFPGHDTENWPGLGEEPSASYHQGVVARVSDFFNATKVEMRDRQFLRHTMGSWGGFSGSPIILADGHVVAIHNAAGSRQSGSVVALLSYGIRIDCLWELLAYHQLAGETPIPLAAADLRLERFEGDDPRLQEIYEVRQLIRQALVLSSQDKFAEAAKLDNEAVRRIPTYALAHENLSYCYSDYANSLHRAEAQGKPVDLAEYVRYRQYAVKSITRALELDPTNLDLLIAVAAAKRGLEAAVELARGSDPTDSPATRALADKLLQSHGKALDGEQLNSIYTLYANSYPYAKDAVPWHTKAIEADPYQPHSYRSRAMNLRSIGQSAQADADDRRAEELDAAFLDQAQAWKLATSRDASLRNGPEALRLAEKANEATHYGEWAKLVVLAAAYAENGRFDEAQRWAAKALELCPEKFKSMAREQLAVYRRRQAVRD